MVKCAVVSGMPEGPACWSLSDELAALNFKVLIPGVLGGFFCDFLGGFGGFSFLRALLA